MVTNEAAHNIVGIIGNVISFGMFISPVPTFVRIIKKKSVEDFKPDPYIATVLNCLFWIFYGMPFVKPDSLLVITINSIGLVLQLTYLSIYFVYATPKGRKKVLGWLSFEVAFYVIIIVITLLAEHGTKQRSLMVGVICDIFNITMYAAPLTVMAKVIETKSVKYMPFFLSLSIFLNGCVWVIYALIKFDIFILISNGLGAICAAGQLILYAWYYRTTPKDDEDTKPNHEVQLSSNTARL